MDFRLNEDQLALREGLRSFCEGLAPDERLAEWAAAGRLDREVWGQLAEMGLFSLRLPESQSGVGLGMADAVVAFAELGRRVVPGPLAWSHLAAEFVEGAATGELLVSGLDLLGDLREPVLVEHLESLDLLLLLRETGVYTVPRDALSGAPVGVPLDPMTPLHHVAHLPEGERVAGPDAARRLRREGAALLAGQQLGIAEATLERATAYALERHQFDRPVGGFQAVKHLLSDMFVRQEVARAAAYAAGATLDDPAVGDPARAVAAAKITAGEAALKNARACIQVHGGMGYTWEVPVHYYLKRATVLETVFGTSDEHCTALADTFDSAA
ncbi:MAG: acyl-CoA/acyl-ACP dehydrogenase [Proteobacteria bacterium]|nr:acyl-CoA/acyl-ACP dehydrogenase [Pseudomonadota bacterium]